jgi:preprotein translocase subunit SecE
MKKIVAYFKDSYNELVHKVSWPTQKELTSSAVVVMFASLVIAVVILVIDSAFDGIMKIIY